MIVTYRDDLGLVSVTINDTYGIQFDGYENVYFTDTDGKDYKMPMQHLVSIAKDDWYKAE